MSELKTKVNDGSVDAYLKSVEPETKREDCLAILELMKQATGEEPKMWGDSIVGFGSYHYKGKSGREGDWFLTGFAARKQALTLYIMAGFEKYDDLLADLGKFTTGKGCLYIKKLEDVDEKKLRKLVKLSAEHMAASSVQ
jgi:hypothetical protein